MHEEEQCVYKRKCVCVLGYQFSIYIATLLTKLGAIGESPNRLIAAEVQPTQSSLGGHITQHILPASSEVGHLNHVTVHCRIHEPLQ